MPSKAPKRTMRRATAKVRVQMTEVESRALRKEARKYLTALKQLSRTVMVGVCHVDALMRQPASTERDSSVAKVMNAIEIENDRVRFFTLGVDYRDDRAKAEARQRAEFHRRECFLHTTGTRIWSVAAKPIRVWQYRFVQQPIPVAKLVHGQNATLLDEGHDWTWRAGVLTYTGSDRSAKFWIVCEHRGPQPQLSTTK